MTIYEQIITVMLCVAATMLTRFIPFLVFSSKKPTPPLIRYLGNALPAAIFAMLVVYCLKNTPFLFGYHGMPEIIGIVFTAGLHLWLRQMLISIAGGTAAYMLLVHFVFP